MSRLYTIDKLTPNRPYRFCEITRVANIPVSTLKHWRSKGWLVVSRNRPSVATGMNVIAAHDRRLGL